jgi:tetratricopeptide (TPR) repeat protein
LPGIFAADFFEYFGENSKFYVFIDTYEALWDGLRDKGSFHEKDKWIRDNLIPNMSGVSWVICGREKLLWVPECDSDWDMYLEQHPVDELPKKDCTKFLVDCGIKNKDIRNVIIEASEKVPYYLNLSVDTFEKINKSRQPSSKDFGKTQPEIFNTFVKYLSTSEIHALEVLSAPNFWDRYLFEILMKKFDTGFPSSAFSELIKFSFIKTDTNGKYSIHQLMRKSLQEHQDSTDRKNTHQFLLTYYSNKIEDLDIKAITPEHETALTEAFYHAKEALEAEELCKWFVSVSYPFDRAALWQLITPMYEEMLQILEIKLGSDHLVVATALNNLAGLYFEIGNYDKALPLYQRAFDIREKALGPKCPIFGSTLNRFGLLYHYMGECEKALPLYQRALDIFENVLGPQHPIVATTLNNIAGVYLDIKDYKKALPLYYRALNIQEKESDPQRSPDIAITLNNIGLLLHYMKKYDGALMFYQTALEIHEKNLTPKYPEVVMTLNNLALIHESMGDYEKSLPFYQRALDIHESMLSSPDQHFARTLNNLAGLYESMGEHKKALPHYKRALEIIEEVLGQSHSTTMEIKNNYDGLLSKINEENEEK